MPHVLVVAASEFSNPVPFLVTMKADDRLFHDGPPGAAPSSVFSLICLIIEVIVLRRQARLEEAALAARLGPVYLTYQRQVPRWFGRVSR